ncbi:hypothetical protein AgCh_030706 [Apium graveolens]
MYHLHSQAWESKIATSAWWVYPNQVSNTAPTGEGSKVGSFTLWRKKSIFLPAHPLLVKIFGMLFRLDESSLDSHLNERRVRGEGEGMNYKKELSILKNYQNPSPGKRFHEEAQSTIGN